MKLNEIIEYIAILSGLLLPFNILSIVYYMVKTREFRLKNSITVVLGTFVVALAYIYLQPSQRLYMLLMTVGILTVFCIVVGVMKLIKKL